MSRSDIDYGFAEAASSAPPRDDVHTTAVMHLEPVDLPALDQMSPSDEAFDRRDRGEDVSFNVDGRVFNAHKKMLSARSSYFNTLLQLQFGSELEVEIDIRDVSAPMFELLLRFLYFGTVGSGDLGSLDLWSVYKAAGRYQLEVLRQQIQQIICKNITAFNIATVWDKAQQHEARIIMRGCERFFKDHTNEILGNPDFRRIGSKILLNHVAIDPTADPKILYAYSAITGNRRPSTDSQHMVPDLPARPSPPVESQQQARHLSERIAAPRPVYGTPPPRSPPAVPDTSTTFHPVSMNAARPESSLAELPPIRSQPRSPSPVVERQPARRGSAGGHPDSSNESMDQALDHLHDLINLLNLLLDADRSSVFLHDRITKELCTLITIGSETLSIRLPENVGIVGAIFSSGELINIANAYTDKRFYSNVDQKTGYRTDSVLGVPIRVGKGDSAVVAGVLEVLNKKNGQAFDSEDEQHLQMFAALVSALIGRSRLWEISPLKRRHFDISPEEPPIRAHSPPKRALSPSPAPAEPTHPPAAQAEASSMVHAGTAEPSSKRGKYNFPVFHFRNRRT